MPLEAANLAAVQRIQSWLDASIDAYQTIGVETVLSSPKYRDLIVAADARGFEIRMIYVVLASAELQLERIKERVSVGGHDVPEEKVRSRRLRSFEQLAWFAAHVDKLWIYDNSHGEPDLIGAKWHDRIVELETWPTDLAAAIPSELRRQEL